jgi:hypothetical protein
MKHKSGITYLSIREEDQERLRAEFSDRHIHYGFNVKSRKLEAWYRPENSFPYLITSADSVQHALYLMRQRVANDNIGAKILLNQIDIHNDKLVQGKDAEVICEISHELKHIAAGRKFFTPSMAANMVKCRKVIGA